VGLRDFFRYQRALRVQVGLVGPFFAFTWADQLGFAKGQENTKYLTTYPHFVR
jgi:hypothetical protein